MFAVAPLVPHVALRVRPWTTLALSAAIAVVSVWTLSQATVRGVGPAATLSAGSWGFHRDASVVHALTALFVHADLMHLVCNLAFLALAGACLEQAWGGARVLGLFLGAGALAIAFDAFSAVDRTPIVGASAGVSALFGACCVRFRTRKLTFAYVYFDYLRPRAGRFTVSAAAVGVAWAVQQTLGVAWNACSGDDSIAFASHAAGTVFGMALGLASERRRLVLQKQPS